MPETKKLDWRTASVRQHAENVLAKQERAVERTLPKVAVTRESLKAAALGELTDRPLGKFVTEHKSAVRTYSNAETCAREIDAKIGAGVFNAPVELSDDAEKAFWDAYSVLMNKPSADERRGALNTMRAAAVRGVKTAVAV